MPVAGDFTDFCSRHYGELVSALRAYGLDLETSEDLAQETLIRACSRWQRVRDLDSPGAWAHRVAINLAHSHARRARTHARALLRLRPPDGTRGSESERVERVVLRQTLLRLPMRERQVLVLRYVCDRSVGETAVALGITPSAVTSLTHRALTR